MLDTNLFSPLNPELVKQISVGIAIKEIEPKRRHVGLVYDLDGDARLLHLGWHQEVHDWDCPNGDRYLGAPLGLPLDEIAKKVLVGFLDSVKDSIGLVPYGIDFEIAIDAVNADATLKDLPIGKGLSCATFVAAVLKAARYMPIKPETWANADSDDIEWHNWIIQMMELHLVPPEHIENVRNDIGCKRLRPEQIAAACTTNKWPVSRDIADRIANQVICDISLLAPAEIKIKTADQ